MYATALRMARSLPLCGGMSNFSMSVELYMTTDVVCAHQGDTLPQIQKKLTENAISAVPVVDDDGAPIGVLSRTDLIRSGRVEAGRRPKSALLVLPDKRVEEVMTKTVVTVPSDATVRDAAAKMLKRRYHRTYVVDGERLVGVFSTKEAMLAVAEARVKHPLSEYMSSPVFTVRAEEPIALATERLDKAHVTGLVVVENNWPVGVFTQRESLMSASLPRDTAVEDAMSPAMLCLQSDTAAHRAAAQAAATTVRRVIVTDKRDMVGILTGLDFARAVQ